MIGYCNINTGPTLKNLYELIKIHHVHCAASFERSRQFEIFAAHVHLHSPGEYRCKADNNVGAILYKSAYLEILNPPILTLSDPVQYGVPGKTVQLSVMVTYQNKLDGSNVKWTRNGEIIEAKKDETRFLNNGLTLEIGILLIRCAQCRSTARACFLKCASHTMRV